MNRLDRSDLHEAVIDKDIERVQELLLSTKLKEIVNLRDTAGWTALHFAAQEGSIEIAKLLIEAGAEIDAQDSHGNTPLMKAVFNSKGQGDMILLLRQHGADPYKSNKHSQTPLGLARLIANYNIMQYFSDAHDASI